MKTMKNAFTLAEVLITLGIIGIVAALTLPTLIQKQNEKVTITKLKKTYSILQNAYMQATNEYGTPDNWNLIGTDSGEGAVNMSNIMANYLKFSKFCGTETGCMPDTVYKNLNGQNFRNMDNTDFISKAILNDGTLIYFQVNSPTCDQYNEVNPKPLNQNCGGIFVDINGFKGPNTKGIDGFYFMINKLGIFPFGGMNDILGSFNTKCYNNGFSCAAWVLYNENMDYLHCDDLDWNSKSSCK